jgi:hypothetical protein
MTVKQSSEPTLLITLFCADQEHLSSSEEPVPPLSLCRAVDWELHHSEYFLLMTQRLNENFYYCEVSLPPFPSLNFFLTLMHLENYWHVFKQLRKVSYTLKNLSCKVIWMSFTFYVSVNLLSRLLSVTFSFNMELVFLKADIEKRVLNL